jgi:hypothetical protein
MFHHPQSPSIEIRNTRILRLSTIFWQEITLYIVTQCKRNSKNNKEGATVYLKGLGYYSEATRDNIKEADCAGRDTGAEQLCAEYFVFGLAFAGSWKRQRYRL